MKLIACLLTLLLAPTVGALAGLIALPLVLGVGHRPVLRVIIRTAMAMLGAFAAVWAGRLMFTLLGTKPTLLVAFVLGAGYAMNDIRRLRWGFGARTPLLLADLVGDLSGIVAGAFIFLARA